MIQNSDHNPADLSKRSVLETVIDEDELEKRRKRLQKNHGPRPVIFLTNGQMRRQRVRDIFSARRKSTKQSRKAYHQGELEYAALRGQLQVIGAIPSQPQRHGDPESIRRVVLERFGSVEDAVRLFEVITERRRSHLARAGA